MSAPSPRMEAAGGAAAEALLDALKTIDPADKARHAAVLDYWLALRGSRELPPLRDLDPLEISDAAPHSALLELIGGGEDAEIRHLGEKLRPAEPVEKISEAARPSLLACIARKLSIAAISRNFLAFEDEFVIDGAVTRCWVTLLPLSAAGAWVDYIYAFATYAPVEAGEGTEGSTSGTEEVLELEPAIEEPLEADELPEPAVIDQLPETSDAEPAPVLEEVAAPAKKAPGFSFDPGAGGFYATSAVKVKPTLPQLKPAPVEAAPEPVIDDMEVTETLELTETEELAAQVPDDVGGAADVEPVSELPESIEVEPVEEPRKPSSALEGDLQSKLTEVRAKADEARMAKLRANAALYEGLSAAYDFALDAEESPEEYLRLVEGQGLKIQLRSPMRPVVKLAFDGLCDESTIAQLEAVLAWAIDQDLPRGSLGQRIEEAGGIAPILAGEKRAA